MCPVRMRGGKEIALRGARGIGRVALVDEADLPVVAGYCWHVSAQGYAVASVGPRAARRRVVMHRLICPPPDGLEVDHINGDKLDNRRANLRAVTRAENAQNLRGAHRDSQTGVRNVSWRPDRGRYEVGVMRAGRRYRARFKTLDEAAAAAEAARRTAMGGETACRSA
jgi:hypothetical protein